MLYTDISSDKELKEVGHDWMAQQANDFSRVTDVQLECWRRCLKRGGNYAEN